MNELFTQLWEQLQQRSVSLLVATVAGFVGWLIGYWRARQRWARREFYDRLNLSLNLLVDGKLLIRTLAEKRCEDVFLNSAAAKAVVDAAKLTTPANPILPLPKEDYWFYLNAVLNDLSEQFAEGQMRRALGQPVTCGKFLVCLTSEADGNVRMRKIRAMVIAEGLLQNLPDEPPQFSSPHHSTRWKTLKSLANAYGQTPDQFILVELCS